MHTWETSHANGISSESYGWCASCGASPWYDNKKVVYASEHRWYNSCFSLFGILVQFGKFLLDNNQNYFKSNHRSIFLSLRSKIQRLDQISPSYLHQFSFFLRLHWLNLDPSPPRRLRRCPSWLGPKIHHTCLLLDVTSSSPELLNIPHPHLQLWQRPSATAPHPTPSPSVLPMIAAPHTNMVEIARLSTSHLVLAPLNCLPHCPVSPRRLSRSCARPTFPGRLYMCRINMLC